MDGQAIEDTALQKQSGMMPPQMQTSPQLLLSISKGAERAALVLSDLFEKGTG